MAWPDTSALRHGLLALLLLTGTTAVASGAPAATAATASPQQDLPVPVTTADPELTSALDAAVALGAADTCLTVVSDGVRVYDHRGDDLQIPASTQKLFTTSALLDELDPASTLRTEVVTAAPVTNGVVEGDVVLVGGGDPVLTTARYRDLAGVPDSRPTTSFDDLAQQMANAGIREVRGRILVDDHRYDDNRVVPSWPERYVGENQAGPLGALAIDRGFVLEQDGDEPVQWSRAGDPALVAGFTLQDQLATRLIPVRGLPASGSRPAGASALAAVDSPPISVLVDDLLLRSDNQMAELLLKELGHATAGEGSTAAGAREVAAWTRAAGAASPGANVVDGSGLDRGNQTTCQDLVAALDVGGPTGAIAEALPVAGQTGTLRRRFAGTEVEGVLRAKTGSLNGVRALAGFVALPEGATVTFAMIANGEVGDGDPAQAEAFVANLLATWRPPCPTPDLAPIIAPTPLLAIALSTSSAGDAAAVPTAAVALEALSTPATAPMDRCSRDAEVEVDLGMG